MNNERRLARGRLLNDVLAVESGREKAMAMVAFRRARFGRRVRAFGGLAVIVAAALAVGVHYYRIERPASIAVKTAQPPALTTAAENSGPLLKLTDEELLATFPSNSCFLAEVNGRQVLVFTDRSMREKVFHKPADPSSQASF
jgi:hypothetical protein